MNDQSVVIFANDIETSGKISIDKKKINLNLGITNQVISLNDIKVVDKNDDHSISIVLSDNSLITLKLKDYLLLYKIIKDYIENKRNNKSSGIKCKECGEFNNIYNKECNNCGFPIKKKKKISKKTINIILGVILFIEATIFSYLYVIPKIKDIYEKKLYTSQNCFKVKDETIISYDGSCTKDVVIPNTINGKEIKIIGENAFAEKSINSVVIPEGIVRIKKDAFSRNNIKELIIPNTITSINANAFMSNKITKITLSENLTFIGSWSFDGNYIEDLIIPDSVKTIKYEAFANNNLKKIVIGKSIEIMEYGVFGQYDWDEPFYLNDGGEQNKYITKIVNKTGKQFDWYYILAHNSMFAGSEMLLETGIVETKFGKIEVAKE